MPNKDRNKRSVRQARQRERAERDALAAAAAPEKKSKKKTSSQAPVKVDPAKQTGFIARTKNYLGDVRSEMRRVTWPSKTELTNYSVAVIAMLIVFGVAVWLIDTGFVAGLVAFTGLRG